MCSALHQSAKVDIPALMGTTVRKHVVLLRHKVDESVVTIDYYPPIIWEISDVAKLSRR